MKLFSAGFAIFLFCATAFAQNAIAVESAEGFNSIEQLLRENADELELLGVDNRHARKIISSDVFRIQPRPWA